MASGGREGGGGGRGGAEAGLRRRPGKGLSALLGLVTMLCLESCL